MWDPSIDIIQLCAIPESHTGDFRGTQADGRARTSLMSLVAGVRK